MNEEPFQPERLFLSPTDVYTDGFSLLASAYTISFLFSLTIGPDGQQQPQAIVRMSPQHAKMMAMMLKRHLKRYEDQMGEITIPPGLLEEKEVNLKRDW